MKLLLPLLLLIGVATPLYLLSFSNTLIESVESKTIDNDPVFNKISFKSGRYKDIWYMAQSHKGVQLPAKQWDQIKIIVDKTTTPFTATYHQFRNGKEIELRAACFICHANGPRAIRPNYESKKVNNGIKDRVLISLMNLRIKSYGRVLMKKENLMLNGKPRVRPLTYHGPKNWETLQVKTCLKCHSEIGYFSRGHLKAQQVQTIKHLTDSGEMPPWPYKLTEEEKKELQTYINK